MTKEQTKLVEDNHNLIYSFLYSNSLSVEEYYDIAAIGLCKAAIHYDSNRLAFSTFAYTVMLNEVKIVWRHQRSKSSIPEVLITSIDNPIPNSKGESVNIHEVVPDRDTCTEDTAVFNATLGSLTSLLTDKEREVLRYVYNGLTQVQVSKALGISQAEVSRKLKHIRQKFLSMY